jgi:hypothetical protein
VKEARRQKSVKVYHGYNIVGVESPPPLDRLKILRLLAGHEITKKVYPTKYMLFDYNIYAFNVYDMYNKGCTFI